MALSMNNKFKISLYDTFFVLTGHISQINEPSIDIKGYGKQFSENGHRAKRQSIVSGPFETEPVIL